MNYICVVAVYGSGEEAPHPDDYIPQSNVYKEISFDTVGDRQVLVILFKEEIGKDFRETLASLRVKYTKLLCTKRISIVVI